MRTSHRRETRRPKVSYGYRFKMAPSGAARTARRFGRAVGVDAPRVRLARRSRAPFRVERPEGWRSKDPRRLGADASTRTSGLAPVQSRCRLLDANSRELVKSCTCTRKIVESCCHSRSCASSTPNVVVNRFTVHAHRPPPSSPPPFVAAARPRHTARRVTSSIAARASSNEHVGSKPASAATTARSLAAPRARAALAPAAGAKRTPPPPPAPPAASIAASSSHLARTEPGSPASRARSNPHAIARLRSVATAPFPTHAYAHPPAIKTYTPSDSRRSLVSPPPSDPLGPTREKTTPPAA